MKTIETKFDFKDILYFFNPTAPVICLYCNGNPILTEKPNYKCTKCYNGFVSGEPNLLSTSIKEISIRNYSDNKFDNIYYQIHGYNFFIAEKYILPISKYFKNINKNEYIYFYNDLSIEILNKSESEILNLIQIFKSQ